MSSSDSSPCNDFAVKASIVSKALNAKLYVTHFFCRSARLRSVQAKVDSRKDAGENFNVLTNEQKAAIKAKRDKKRSKRLKQERENLRKKGEGGRGIVKVMVLISHVCV